MKQWEYKSPVGTFYLVASSKGLSGVLWRRRRDVPMLESLSSREPEARFLAKTAGQLGEYFKGARREFDLPLDLEGTEFQKKVWQQLRKIPYGETASYKEIAKRLRNEGAVRAVGTANSRNPISVIVPCHRVIRAGGQLGGYAGGLSTKARLLELEQRG